MTDAKRHLMTIFTAALDNAPAARAAYLDKACAGDAALRARVEDLLRAHEQAGHFLEPPPRDPGISTGADAAEPPADTADGPAPRSETNAPIAGRYKLLEEIGEGGMGTVWMAEQSQPVRRTIALKILKAGMDTRQVAEATGLESHGRQFGSNAEVLAHPPGTYPQYTSRQWTVPEAFLTEKGRPHPDLSLRPGSPAIGAGVTVPNIMERADGRPPGLGALQFGQPMTHYGPRP
jgi:hypothetical protein